MFLSFLKKLRSFLKESHFVKDVYYFFRKSFSSLKSKLRSDNSMNDDKRLILDNNKGKLPTIEQLKQIKHFLSLKEKRILIIFISLAIISLSLFLGKIFWNFLIEVPRYGGEYTEGVVGSISYINPLLSQTNDVDRDISKLVFSGLFRMNNDGELEKDLISGYEISDDQKTYTFTLKDNIYFHDDTKLIPEDIEFTLTSIQDQSFNSPLYKTFKGIVYEKVSDNSFRLILTEAFSPFLSTLTFGILPSHLWQNIPAGNSGLTELNKKPIGTGPFQYKSFKKDSSGKIIQYTLYRFDDYYGKKPYLKIINFKLFDDTDTAIEYLKSGRINGIGFLSQDNLSKVEDLNSINIHTFDMPRYTALFFNPKNQELLKDKNIRQAISLAINKKELAQEAEISEKEAYGPLDFIINPGTDEYDIKKSAELLKSAGWSLEDGTLKKGDKKLELTITSVDNAEYIKILQYIKRQWGKIGIVTNLEIIPKDKITSQTIEPRNYQILLYGQILSYDPDPYPFWHSSQVVTGLNLSIFADKDIDSILESARTTTLFDERIKKYEEFQKILKDQYMSIFLFRPTYNYPVSKNIKGVDGKIVYLSSDRFSNIYNWYIKTKKTFKTKNN